MGSVHSLWGSISSVSALWQPGCSHLLTVSPWLGCSQEMTFPGTGPLAARGQLLTRSHRCWLLGPRVHGHGMGQGAACLSPEHLLPFLEKTYPPLPLLTCPSHVRHLPDRPQPPSKPAVRQEDVKARSVLLSWEPGSDGLSPVRYYTIQTRELPSGRWALHSASVSHNASAFIVDR